ncbi:putative chloride channel-like protein [Drosera capensis]
MVHAGASIASLLGQGGSKKYGLTWKWLRYFKNDRDRRDLVTCGAAAGIAAACRSPVGGLLFSLEGMTSWSRSALLWRAFFSTTIVAIMLRAFVVFCYSGKCGLFGTGGLIMYNVTSQNVVYHFSDIPIVLILGVVGGVLGSLHNYLLQKLLRVYNMINKSSRLMGFFFKIFLACSISLFTSCLLFGLPWLASCQAFPTDSEEVCPTIGRSGNYKKFQCAEGHYNDLASLIFNTNDDTIRNLFSGNTDSEFHGTTMLTFLMSCFFLSIISYGIVLPAGLFVTMIVTGAAYGRYVGMLMGSKSSMDHGLYAVLGTASLLGGSMRTTVSLGVILLELTNNLLLLLLVMLVLLVSKTVADASNRSIYDLIIKLKGFPYLTTHVEPYMRQLTVSEVVTGPLQYFHGIEKKKAFLTAPVSTGINLFQQFTPVDFAKRGTGKTDMVEDIDFTDEEMEMFIDLHPFTKASPYTFIETMSLAKALILFREVGLRHLLCLGNSFSLWVSGGGHIDKERLHARTHSWFASCACEQQVEEVKVPSPPSSIFLRTLIYL